MIIHFTKAHGARNDFLLSWIDQSLPDDLPAAARAICDRHTGIGADGWMLVSASDAADARIRLFNSDGSEAEISGNGTRCAAAFLIDVGRTPWSAADPPVGLAGSAFTPRGDQGVARGPGGPPHKQEIRILTGAGVKHLRLMGRSGLHFDFEMNMGRPTFPPGETRLALPLEAGPREVTVVWVGNPQCAVFVEDFAFDWRKMGAEIERHPHFPNRTNVSFIRLIDRHTLEVRFFERGAGETFSSGTGSTGAVAAAIARGIAESPVRVLTAAGPLEFRCEDEIVMQGPADIVGKGEFYL